MENNYFIKSLSLLDGIITYKDFDINENIAFKELWYAYKEDILQVVYGDRYILDVGWYPESNPKGRFIVRAIQDYDWMDPLLKIKCKTFEELKKAIEDAAHLLNERNTMKNVPYRDVEYESNL